MIKFRRCPLCRKQRSVTSGKHRIEERRWHPHRLGRICWICHAVLGKVQPEVREPASSE